MHSFEPLFLWLSINPYPKEKLNYNELGSNNGLHFYGHTDSSGSPDTFAEIIQKQVPGLPDGVLLFNIALQPDDGKNY